MAKKFTDAQLDAINERSKTLLVSAAAGSGKTTTLIERILRSITQKDSPLMLDRLLAVTFTKPAASELRLRISAVLSEAIAENGEDELLAKQMTLLPSAKISTIDSFYLNLVKQNYAALGLSPSFRMADEGESALIASETMEMLINECYDNESSTICGGPGGFASLVDILIGSGDDRGLSEILLSLHEKLSAYPKGAAALYDRENELREYAKHDFFDCEHGKRIEKHLLSFFEYYKKGYMYCLDLISQNEKLSAIYTPYYEEDLHNIFGIEKALKEGYASGKAAIEALSFARISGGYRGEKDENFFYVKEFRTDFKAKLKRSVFPYIESDSDTVSEVLLETADICHNVADFLCEYERRAEAEKKRRAVCDFSDLSRYTLRLLVDENGNDTPFALAQKELYDAVYIDEYQDVNAVQDRIFEAISTKTNRFMVGDIKQSIYGFRGAEPAIFAKMRRSYPALAESDGYDGAAIFMSENFRCNKEVIDFTNIIFDRLMPLISPEINYTSSDSLVFKKTCESDAPTPVRIVISEKPPKDAPDFDRHTEAEFILSEIKRLVATEKKDNGNPITYGDIAILIRSRRYLDAFANTLKENGIPVYTETAENLLTQSEVMIIRCLLDTIDNPRRDISLCGIMLSPLCGLSHDFFAALRKDAKRERLITTLKRYLEEAEECEEKNKVRYFFEMLGEFRKMAKFLSAGELIDEIYTRYAAYSRLCAKSASRRANLDKFKELAYNFGGESRSLCEFVRYLQSVEDNAKVTLKAARPGVDTEDAVRIMTVHHSKGLEFPVVFFADTVKEYNLQDSWLSPLYSGSAGFGMKLRDKSGFCQYDTLLRKSIAISVERTLKEEELRLLYVALTRARERLYITAMDSSPDDLIVDAKNGGRFLTEYAASRQKTHLDLILLAIANEDAPFISVETHRYAPLCSTEETVENAAEESIAPDEELSSVLEERFEYVYPHIARTKIPAKLAISKLYPDILDDALLSETIELKKHIKPIEAPRFIAGEEESGSKRGTATHLFMQFFDFDNTVKNGVEAEISRLTERHFITEQDAKLVNIYEVKRFVESNLFAKMKDAKRIYREQRFNLTLDAKNFAQDESLKTELEGENVLVQGVIDCFFYDSDGEIILVDYKTDRLPKDRKEAEAKLRAAHSTQLLYYARAVEEMCGKPPKKVLIYSLCLGDVVEIQKS